MPTAWNMSRTREPRGAATTGRARRQRRATPAAPLDRARGRALTTVPPDDRAACAGRVGDESNAATANPRAGNRR